MTRGAILSDDERYRYLLWRPTENKEPSYKRPVTFIMLNPSTADHNEDDPTVRRCMDFGARWGFGSIVIVNLFAFRTPYPRELKEALGNDVDIEGPDNEFHVLNAAEHSDLIVAAWGTHGEIDQQDVNMLAAVINSGYELHHLGLTAKNMPKHPVRLAKTTKPELWTYTECRICGDVSCMYPGDWDLCLEHTED